MSLQTALTEALDLNVTQQGILNDMFPEAIAPEVSDSIGVGDEVVLKSGSPFMTVESLDGDMADLVWFNPNGATNHDSITIGALKKPNYVHGECTVREDCLDEDVDAKAFELGGLVFLKSDVDIDLLFTIIGIDDEDQELLVSMVSNGEYKETLLPYEAVVIL